MLLGLVGDVLYVAVDFALFRLVQFYANSLDMAACGRGRNSNLILLLSRLSGAITSYLLVYSVVVLFYVRFASST